MTTKTTIGAITAILLAATASSAFARGYVMPGSLDGVNPADHPRIFNNAASVEAYGFAKTPHGWVVAKPNPGTSKTE